MVLVINFFLRDQFARSFDRVVGERKDEIRLKQNTKRFAHFLRFNRAEKKPNQGT